MEDLIKLYAFRIKALETRNEYLENEVKQAKQLFQDIINDWEVHQEQEVNVLDKIFSSPLEQLNNLY